MNDNPLQFRIMELWHVSRIALATLPHVATRHDRMLYIKDALIKHSPELVEGLTNKKIWFEIEYFLDGSN